MERELYRGRVYFSAADDRGAALSPREEFHPELIDLTFPQRGVPLPDVKRIYVDRLKQSGNPDQVRYAESLERRKDLR